MEKSSRIEMNLNFFFFQFYLLSTNVFDGKIV